jgi:DNA repair protein RAD50
MTSVEKLLIQGVRSFSPQVPQTIEFYKPLTLIVGENGAGKTVRS